MKPALLGGGLLAFLMLPIIAFAVIAAAILAPAIGAGECGQATAGIAPISGTWQRPFKGTGVVTSQYGMRLHPVTHVYKLHSGTDVALLANKTIMAAADGTVTTSSYNTAYGNQVVIDHGGNVATRYAHMAAPSPVKVGQKVGAGTALGREGSTGYVTGAHLHFEVMKSGKPINPIAFMHKQGAPLTGAQKTKTVAKTEQIATSRSVARASTLPKALTGTLTSGTSFTLNTEQIGNAALVAKIGRKAGVSDRGIIIALMVALQESKLMNLNYGDRDSVGLFQQRPSTGWGTSAQIQTPSFSIAAFFGGPTGPHKGVPPGLLDTPGWKSMLPGQAGQAVQRSGFPKAYDQWEPLARRLFAAVEHSAGGVADVDAC